MTAPAHAHSRQRLRPWQRLACCAALLVGDWALAAEAPEPCEADIAPGHVMSDRSGIIASLERMPDSCLKWMLIECSENASRQFMDLGSAAVCSMGYEALLKKSFGGNFDALIEWWRRERHQRSTL